MTLLFHNTLTRKKEEFTPLDPNNVRMYVCGPTVYGRAHLGNARSVVVYDVMFRLLRAVYGEAHVTYARNITDVDDKINAAAKERGITIKELTTEVTQWFHDDMAALGVLPANANKDSGLMVEPKATDHIAQMVAMIERLISNAKAYVSQGHVLFEVASCKRQVSDAAHSRLATRDSQLPYYYGRLSGRVQEELEAGARVKVESYKRDPNDFVLWKPADTKDDPSSIFESPWGPGRPGWHIECSAMSTHYLGETFDMHGGGSDLMFPHHENEIAQALGAYPQSQFARYWVHNGFLTVNGEKMSKSVGNFITVRDLLDKGVRGEVIRWALLSTKYNEPLDWNEKMLADAKKSLDYFYRAIAKGDNGKFDCEKDPDFAEVSQLFFDTMGDDLNAPATRALLYMWAKGVLETDDASQARAQSRAYYASLLKHFGAILGILQSSPEDWFKGEGTDTAGGSLTATHIESQINARIAAKQARNFAEADRIRAELKAQGILLEDRPGGATDWRRE